MALLTIRKLADRSVGERERRYHPETGQAFLVDPAEPLDAEHESALSALPEPARQLAAAALAKPKPWPLAGVSIVDPPAQTTISAKKVAEGIREKWISLVGERIVEEPAGPTSNPWLTTHVFRQADELVFHTVDGDLRYRVTGQPGKHPDESEPSGFRVDWFYTLERIDA